MVQRWLGSGSHWLWVEGEGRDDVEVWEGAGEVGRGRPATSAALGGGRAQRPCGAMFGSLYRQKRGRVVDRGGRLCRRRGLFLLLGARAVSALPQPRADQERRAEK